MLEAGGLIDVRVGARGGAFVTLPTNARLGEGLADLLQLSPLTAAEVTEARMVFELGIVPLVVERATEEDLVALERLCEEQQAALADERYTMEMSAEFHVRVAASTHNKAVEMLVHSFHGPLLMSLKEAQIAEPLMGHRGCARAPRVRARGAPAGRRRGGVDHAHAHRPDGDPRRSLSGSGVLERGQRRVVEQDEQHL